MSQFLDYQVLVQVMYTSHRTEIHLRHAMDELDQLRKQNVELRKLAADLKDVHLNPDVSKDDAVKSLRKRLERATKELKLLAEKKSLNVSSAFICSILSSINNNRFCLSSRISFVAMVSLLVYLIFPSLSLPPCLCLSSSFPLLPPPPSLLSLSPPPSSLLPPSLSLSLLPLSLSLCPSLLPPSLCLLPPLSLSLSSLLCLSSLSSPPPSLSLLPPSLCLSSLPLSVSPPSLSVFLQLLSISVFSDLSIPTSSYVSVPASPPHLPFPSAIPIETLFSRSLVPHISCFFNLLIWFIHPSSLSLSLFFPSSLSISLFFTRFTSPPRCFFTRFLSASLFFTRCTLRLIVLHPSPRSSSFDTLTRFQLTSPLVILHPVHTLPPRCFSPVHLSYTVVLHRFPLRSLFFTGSHSPVPLFFTWFLSASLFFTRLASPPRYFHRLYSASFFSPVGLSARRFHQLTSPPVVFTGLVLHRFHLSGLVLFTSVPFFSRLSALFSPVDLSPPRCFHRLASRLVVFTRWPLRLVVFHRLTSPPRYFHPVDLSASFWPLRLVVFHRLTSRLVVFHRLCTLRLVVFHPVDTLRLVVFHPVDTLRLVVFHPVDTLRLVVFHPVDTLRLVPSLSSFSPGPFSFVFFTQSLLFRLFHPVPSLSSFSPNSLEEKKII
ncbi:unnamed protein product [Acanthosepion pharaonis]|uniref:Uncharacterized protein n=1 Tax=Acanthosepion pharaonis TaxID=158019 RepID=A0A812CCE2_ACAPH|nr:unnamed protein product [Sepia pharaonis]